MSLTHRRRRELILLAAITLIAALSAPLYGLLFVPAATWLDALEVVPHFVIGGFLTATFLIFVVPTKLGAPFRRLPFLVRAVLFALLLAVIIGIAGVGGQSILEGRFVWEAFVVPSLSLYLFVGVITVALSAVGEVIELTGPRILVAALTGRYNRPRSEDRVFLFIDVVGSTALAERLGAARTQSMLSRLFFDMGEPIARHRGEIHAYVGDEVIVTWPAEKAIANSRCVHCFFAIVDLLQANAQAYERAFGTAPKVRGALHGGEVVMAQVGDARKAIVYFGDTVNTTARLEEFGKQAGQALVASQGLVDRLDLSADIQADPLGPVELRGRREPLEVVALGRRSNGA